MALAGAPEGARGAVPIVRAKDPTSATRRINISIIASLLAATGAAFALALVRSRDFVASAQPSIAPEAEPVEVAAS
jgi:hypothetical protein